MGPPTVRQLSRLDQSSSVTCITNKRLNPRRRVRRRQALQTLCSAAVGIDLGTTNSVVAILREGEPYPTVIRDASGAFTVPSVVSYANSKQVLVGQAAKQQLTVNPLNTFYSVKRLIGKGYNEVQDLGLVYNVTADNHGGVQLQCPSIRAVIRPQQVSLCLSDPIL